MGVNFFSLKIGHRLSLGVSLQRSSLYFQKVLSILSVPLPGETVMGHQPGLRWDVGPQPGGQSWWEVLQEPVTPAPDSTLTTPASDHSGWLVTGTTLPGELCIYTPRAPSGHPGCESRNPSRFPWPGPLHLTSSLFLLVHRLTPSLW